MHGNNNPQLTLNIQNEFRKLLKCLKNLNLPIGEYAIVGSGPLAIRGIREARDIDIIVTKNLWEKLVKEHNIEASPFERFRLEHGTVEVMGNKSVYMSPLVKPAEDLIKEADSIEGNPFVQLHIIKRCKRILATQDGAGDKELYEKCMTDINLIDAYIRNKVRSLHP
jgi:hypothetical protein